MNLITDRKKENVSRLGELSNKLWDSMTDYERAEWSGNPITAGNSSYTGAVNLIPPMGEGVRFWDGSIIADTAGTIVIGEAADFSGNSVTLSAEYISTGGKLSLVWSNGTSAGCELSVAGAVTETLTVSANTQLILSVSAGYYGKAMLELGRTHRSFVPYTEIVPTEATKGAYNFSDFNRVERSVEEIAEILGVSVTTKTNWNGWDIPTPNDLERYLSNVRLLQELCGETTVLPDTLNKMTYDTANKIEEVLLRCRNIAEATLRCGELICGEVL